MFLFLGGEARWGGALFRLIENFPSWLIFSRGRSRSDIFSGVFSEFNYLKVKQIPQRIPLSRFTAIENLIYHSYSATSNGISNQQSEDGRRGLTTQDRVPECVEIRSVFACKCTHTQILMVENWIVLFCSLVQSDIAHNVGCTVLSFSRFHNRLEVFFIVTDGIHANPRLDRWLTITKMENQAKSGRETFVCLSSRSWYVCIVSESVRLLCSWMMCICVTNELSLLCP